MNRRSFLHGILAASIAPLFLPGGGRLWKATLAPPLWEDAAYEVSFIFHPQVASALPDLDYEAFLRTSRISTDFVEWRPTGETSGVKLWRPV